VGQAEKEIEQFVPDFAGNNAIIKYASGARTKNRTQFFVVLNSQAVHQMLASWVLTRGALVGQGPTRKPQTLPTTRDSKTYLRSTSRKITRWCAQGYKRLLLSEDSYATSRGDPKKADSYRQQDITIYS